MYNTNQQTRFHLSLTLIVGALKLHDRELVRSCKKIIVDLLGSEYTDYIATTAVVQISQGDTTTYNWIWQDFPQLESCLVLKEKVVTKAIKKLISKGFIIGSDFSVASADQIMINKPAKMALMETAFEAERLLLKQIFRVPVEKFY